jgi:hypothetical protein
VRVEMRATSRAGRVKKHSADCDHQGEPAKHAGHAEPLA